MVSSTRTQKSTTTAPVRIPESGRQPERRRDHIIARWLLLTLFAFYMATSSGIAPYGDEYAYVNVAQNFLTTGALKSFDYATTDDGQTIKVNEQYVKYPLGQSLLEIPGLLLINLLKPPASIQPLIRNVLPALECALIGVLLFMLLRLPGAKGGEPVLSPRPAAALALAAAVTTQLWPSAATHFADTSGACLVFAAFFLVVRFHRQAGGGWSLVLAAWAAGLAFSCKNTFLLAWPALALYGTWAARQRYQAGARLAPGRLALILSMIACPLALAIVGQLWFNHLRYGSIWQTGFNVERDGSFGFGTPLLVGLYGILFSSGRSLFLYSPLCLLAFGGWRRMARRFPAELALAAGVALPLLLTYIRWWAWYGGWEWGCRFYLFLVPFLVWLSAPAWARFWNGLRRSRFSDRLRAASLALLLCVSLLVQCLGVLVHPIMPYHMMNREMADLHKPLWMGAFWEARDDMPLVHFVPEFSPVALNAWLVWATWNRERMGEADLAQRAPFHSLNPKLVPRQVAPYLGYKLWVWREWVDPNGSKNRVIVILLALAGLGGFGLVRLVCLTRKIS